MPFRRDPRKPFIIAHCLGVLGLTAWFAINGGSRPADAAHVRDAQDLPVREVAQDLGIDLQEPELPSQVDLRKAKLVDGTYIQRLDDGSSVSFSIDPTMQQTAQRILDRHPILFGSLVAIQPKTGRLLALAETVNNRKVSGRRPALDSRHPAASIFKMVSAAALMEKANVIPSERVCVHGGFRRLTDRNIIGDKRRDKRCRPFATALGHSDNAIFARLAYTRLQPEDLKLVAGNFGFGNEWDTLPWDISGSALDLPDPEQRTDFARISAGFWHSTISPMHAAMLTAAVANGGKLRSPTEVDRWVGSDGEVILEAEPNTLGRIARPSTVRALSRMMVETTTRGTARKAFGRYRDWPFGKTMEVAGKTGSLNRYEKDFVSYSWFVAFAPARKPEVAVAALVGNPEKWYVKGVHVVRDTLAAYFRQQQKSSRVAIAR